MIANISKGDNDDEEKTYTFSIDQPNICPDYIETFDMLR